MNYDDEINASATEWNRKHAPGCNTAKDIQDRGPLCKGTRTEPHRCIVTAYSGPSVCLSDWRLAIGIARIKDERKAAGTYPSW